MTNHNFKMTFLKQISLIILVLLMVASDSALAKEATHEPGAGVKLTQEERAWLQDHPEIRLSPDPDFLPIEYIDKSGKYTGIAADYVHILEKKLGIEFKILKYESWAEVIEKTKNKESDMWGAATPTPQRLEYMLFTKPFIQLPAVIIVREKIKRSLSLKELKGLKVAVISGYGIHDHLSANHPDIKLDVVPDISTGLKKVSFGMVDAMIANIALATYYIEKDGISNLRVAGESGYVYKWGLATRNDWPELNQILQKGISLIDESERVAIHRKWVSLKADPSFTVRDILIPAISVLGLFAVIAIIVSNRILKKQVRKRTEDLQMILNSVGEGIYGLDLNGYTTFANPAAKKMLGYSLEEMSGQPQHSLIHHTKSNGEPNPREECPIYKAFQDGKTYRVEAEDIFWKKDGTSFPVEFVSNPIFENEKIVGAVVTFRDVSKRHKDETLLKQYSNELERSNKELESFAGITSHDLKTPIRKIGNFCALIEEGESQLTKSAINYLKKIEITTKHAADLIDSILNYSQLGSEKTPHELINLNEILTKIIGLLELELKEVKGKVEFNNLPCIMGNKIQMEQLFTNLIYNSLKYQKKDVPPAIKISHHKVSDNNLKIIVQDNGIGFDNAFAKKIFDPFQRLDGNLSNKGSGLGLSICKKIMLAHGGDIVAEGEINNGAKFIISFKLD